jgi:hypothetical protein
MQLDLEEDGFEVSFALALPSADRRENPPPSGDRSGLAIFRGELTKRGFP